MIPEIKNIKHSDVSEEEFKNNSSEEMQKFRDELKSLFDKHGVKAGACVAALKDNQFAQVSCGNPKDVIQMAQFMIMFEQHYLPKEEIC